jgi:hypothetical protein
MTPARKLYLLAALFFYCQQGTAQSNKKLIPALYDSCIGDYIISQWNHFNFNANKTSLLKTTTAITSGTIEITAGYNVVVTAQKEIHLRPGFSALAGSKVRAYIDPAPCNTLPGLKANEAGPNNNLMVYPNPNKGLFVLEIPLTGKSAILFDIFISTADGILIQEKLSQVSGIINFNLQQFSKGMYFLRIVNRSTGQSQFQKIIIL